jgi:ABC-type branched-subunit amino acid transport system substrate-binding protein
MSADRTTTRRTRWPRYLAVTIALGLVATACGDDDDDAAPTATTSATTAAAATTASSGGGGTTVTTSGATAATTGASTATSAVGPPKNTAGFDGTTITLGLVTDNSGPLKAIAAQLTAGAQIYWDYVNTELGGVGGKYKVALKIADNGYDPQKSVQAYQQVKDDVVMIGNILGTPSTQALQEVFADDKMTAVPGSLAAAWVRNANMLPYSTPYEIEMVNGVEFWQTNLNGKGQKACTFSEADAYGEAGMDGLNFAAQKYGFQFTTNTTYKSGDTDFVAQVTELKDKGCQVVFAVANAREFNGVLAASVDQSFSPAWISTLPAYLALLVGADGAGAPRYANVYQVGDGPEFGNTSVPGMKTFLDRAATYNKDFKANTFLLTGYTASIAVQALLEKAVANGDLSRDGMLKALTELGTVDFQGLAGNYTYGPIATRQPPLNNTIFKFDVNKGFDGNFMAKQADITSPFAKDFKL